MSLLWLQDDKDLVPEFVASEGLTCFIKVGAEADHNYQNYILRGETDGSGHTVRIKGILRPKSFHINTQTSHRFDELLPDRICGHRNLDLLQPNPLLLH